MAMKAEELPAGAAAAQGGPGPKKHEHEQTAGLEKVTDYVEEQEISPGELGQAMSIIESDMSRKNEDKARRDQELAKVALKKDEVELIMRELEVPKSVAERSLREHKGDLIKALHALTE